VTARSRSAARPQRALRRHRRRWLYLVLAVAVTCAVVKLPTLWFPHEEADEVIYWQLTDHLAHTGRYSL
jgi:hypothetical protein